METIFKKPTYPTPTGEAIVSPFYPTPTGAPININNIAPKIIASVPTLDTNKIMENISNTLKSRPSFDFNGIIDTIAKNSGISVPVSNTTQNTQKEYSYSLTPVINKLRDTELKFIAGGIPRVLDSNPAPTDILSAFKERAQMTKENIAKFNQELQTPSGIAKASYNAVLSTLGDSGEVKNLLGSQEAFFKNIAKDNKVASIEDKLKNVGLDELNAKNLAPDLASAKTVDEVKQAIIDYQPAGIVPKEPLNPETPISEADKLIAENKIRVVSREGNDVYQYKNQAGEWKTAPNEYTAIARATTEPSPKYYPLDQEKIDATQAQLDITREVLAEHPAKPLLKYLKKGDFQDFKNPNLARTTLEAEKIQRKNKQIIKDAENAFQGHPELQDKFDNPDTIRSVIEDYRARREMEKSLLATKKFFNENVKSINQIIQERKNIVKNARPIDTFNGEGRSIELQANQALSIMNGEEFPMYVSFPKLIEGTVTPVSKKVHLIDTYLRTPAPVMKKIGFGKEAEMLRDATDNYWKELPKEINKTSEWLKKLDELGGKEAQLAVYRWLDGKPITLPFYEKEVAKDIRKWLQDWAKKLNLPEDKRITRYITHIFNREIIEKEFDEELAKIITDKIPKETYDPFLLERLGKKGYIEDLGLSLDAYAKRAVRKVNMDPVLDAIRTRAGVQLEFSNIEKSQFLYIQRYINNIQMRPTPIEEGLDNLIKSVVGYKFGQRPAITLLRMLRQSTFRGMLGLNVSSALRNLSQGINTYAMLGEKYTALGYLKLFNKGSWQELMEEGIMNAGFVEDRALSARKKIIQGADKGLFFLFDTVEKINRGAAYFGAKAKYLAEHIKDKGPYSKIEASARKYGRETVAKTQFLYDTIDTPVGMASGIAKTLFQFQTFNVKQFEFLFNLARGKGYKGINKLKYAIPYLRYILSGLLFTYTIGKAFGMDITELIPFYGSLTGRNTLFGTPPSLKAPVEISKALLNTPDQYGNQRSLEQKGSDILNSLYGLIPAGSQMKKTIQGITAINQGASFSPSGKLQYLQGTSLAQKAQAVIFGKYASQNAKEYFNPKENTQGKDIYDKLVSLVQKGQTDQARAFLNDLSDADYQLYKTYNASQKAKETLQGEKDILPTYLKIAELSKTDPNQAREILNSLSDKEYKYYDLVRKKIEKDIKASQGTEPTYTDGETQTPTGLINTVLLYAKAIGTDPITAFNRIFTGQRIRYIANDAIVVERMSLMASQNVKEKLGGKNANFKLDHLIPLELGGSNAESNLVLVPTDTWASYTPIENYLGKKLRSGEMSKKEVQDLIINFKTGAISAQQVYNK